MNTQLLLRKTMTKKAYKELVKKNRSVVGGGMNTGVRNITSNREYYRPKERRNNHVKM
ncbi:MAG: hypothetical protein K6G01_11065 [Eubacterium sp.]|nr:hypothetical protein [Eubacterium sp.]